MVLSFREFHRFTNCIPIKVAKVQALEKGAIQAIMMIVRWYNEEITEVVLGKKIDYRVNRSFPPVKQDFTEIFFGSTGGYFHKANDYIWWIYGKAFVWYDHQCKEAKT